MGRKCLTEKFSPHPQVRKAVGCLLGAIRGWLAHRLVERLRAAVTDGRSGSTIVQSTPCVAETDYLANVTNGVKSDNHDSNEEVEDDERVFPDVPSLLINDLKLRALGSDASDASPLLKWRGRSLAFNRHSGGCGPEQHSRGVYRHRRSAEQ